MATLPFKSMTMKKENSRTGIASYYAAKFEGRKTTTGERFRQSGMTAASNFYPLHTRVKVTNLKNNATVILKINDRMAHKMSRKNRVVDVTTSAAKQLGFYGQGLTRVKVEKIDK